MSKLFKAGQKHQLLLKNYINNDNNIRLWTSQGVKILLHNEIRGTTNY